MAMPKRSRALVAAPDKPSSTTGVPSDAPSARRSRAALSAARPSSVLVRGRAAADKTARRDGAVTARWRRNPTNPGVGAGPGPYASGCAGSSNGPTQGFKRLRRADRVIDRRPPAHGHDVGGAETC